MGAFREADHRRDRTGRFATKPTLAASTPATADALTATQAEITGDTSEDLMRRWEEAGVDCWVHDHEDRIVVSKVVVPEDQRGAGLGSGFMADVCELADRTGRRVELSPSPDFGGTKSRLIEFYKRFGFVENKGRNRDYEVSEAMYRMPQ